MAATKRVSVVEFPLGRLVVGRPGGGIPDHEAAAASPGCFRSEERLRCVAVSCSWRDECCRLVAEWKR